MVELDNGFSCMYPDCLNCDHADCDAPSIIDNTTLVRRAASLNHKRWTAEEIEYLHKHELDSIESLAKALGRTTNSVKDKINLDAEVKEKRRLKRQAWILEHIKAEKVAKVADIARMMGIPKGVISHDCRRLAQEHEEIERKKGKVKWVECV